MIFLQYSHSRRKNGSVILGSSLNALFIDVVTSMNSYHITGKIKCVHIGMSQPGITAEYKQITGFAEAFIRQFKRPDSSQFFFI